MFKKVVISIIASLTTTFVGFSQTPLPVSRTIWDVGAPAGWTDGNGGTPAYTSTFACSGNNGGRFDNNNEYYEVFFSGTPDVLIYTIKVSAGTTSSLLVEESADGTTYTTVNNHTVLPTSCTIYNFNLLATTQYVRWTYTKVAQNVTIDDVNISQSVPCTPASEPTTNSSLLTFPNTTCNSILLNWTVGDGAKRIVVASLAPIVGTPTDQTNYNANAVFGSGATIAAGEFVVFNGAGNSVTVTGLAASTTYYFAIFEYNGTTINCTENYFLTGVLTGNTTTIACSAPICPEITGILVDACGGAIEGINEFFTFTNGNSNLYLDSLTATFPSGGTFCNSGCGAQNWTTNAVYTDSLNTWAGCAGLFVETDPIPANANVIVFTGASPTYTFDFSGLCGTGPYYAVFANNTSTGGRFANYQAGCGDFRTLTVDFGSTCLDTATYERCLLSSTDGAYVAYDAAGNPTYLNDGCTPTALLPIELLNFSGKPIGATNLLEWTTSTEINNNFFTLEKAKDAIHFNPIGTIDGAGNSNIQLYYHFIDDSPSFGINYYRLKQTDFNGNFAYSSTIAINNELTDFTIYVTNNFLNIQLNSFEFIGNITIYDMTGRKIIEYTINSNLKIDLSTYKKGIYIYRLISGNNSFSDKIILR